MDIPRKLIIEYLWTIIWAVIQKGIFTERAVVDLPENGLGKKELF